jgi:hypothetical protein
MKNRIIAACVAVLLSLTGLEAVAQTVAVSPFAATTVTSNTYKVKWIVTSFPASNTIIALSYSNAAGGGRTGFFTNYTGVGFTNSYTWNISALPYGNFYLFARAMSGTNMANDRSDFVLVKTNAGADITPPTVPTLVMPANNRLTNSLNLTLTWIASSDSGGIQGYQIYTNSRPAASVASNTLNWTAFNIREGAHTWYVKCQDRAGNWSSSNQRTFIIDRTAPTAPILITPVNGKHTNSMFPVLRWNRSTDLGSGVSNYRVIVNGTQIAILSWSITNYSAIMSNNGIKNWRVKAYDKAGNTNVSTSWTMTIDTIPPVAPTLSLPANGSFAATNRLLLIWNKSTDANLTEYRIKIDGTYVASLTNTVTNYRTPVLADGPHTWQITPRDRAGNSNVSAIWTVNVSTSGVTAPSLSRPTNNSYTTANLVNFNWNHSISPALTNSRLLLNGTSVTTVIWYTTNVTRTGLSDGIYTWQIRVRNLAGQSNTSASWVFTIDSILPTAPASVSPADGAFVSTNRPLLIWNRSTDANFQAYKIRIDGALTAVNTNITATNYLTPVLADGAHTWQIVSRDRAGNSNVSAIRTINIIGSAQTVQIPSVWALPSTVTNDSPKVVQFNAFTTASSGSVTNVTLYLSMLGGGIVKMTNLSGFTQFRYAYTVPAGLPAGSKSVSIVARGNGGGIATNGASVTIVSNGLPPSDTTPPSAPGFASPRAFLATNSPIITLRWLRATDAGSGVSNYSILIDSAFVASVLHPVTNWTSGVLADGIHSWQVIAMDRSGNTNSSTVRTMTIDTVAPTAPVLSSPANGSSATNTIWNLSWLAATDAGSGVSNYRLILNNGSWTGFSSGLNLSASLSVGIHSWKVQAADRAGNWSGFSTSWTLNRTVASVTDSTPPAAPTGLQAVTSGGKVYLNWNSSPEPDLGGYRVYRAGFGGSFTLIGTALTNTFTDNATNIAPGDLVRYKLTAVDTSANESSASPEIQLTLLSLQTNQQEEPAVLSRNLVTPDTEQEVTITVSGKTGQVKIRVLDVTGRLVSRIYNGQLEPGQNFFTWSLIDTPNLPAGLYIVVMEGRNWSQTEKVFLVK